MKALNLEQFPSELAALAASRWALLVENVPEFSNLPAPTITACQQVLALSDFFASSLQANPSLLTDLLHYQPLQSDLSVPDINTELSALIEISDEKRAFGLLREVRQRQMLLIAWRDMLGIADIEHSLAHISALANALISAAYHWCYRHLSGRYGTPKDEQGNDMPMLVLGMGKLGGNELNFSSDIDLIFTYPAGGETSGGRKSIEHHQFFVKLGQKLIAALSQSSALGNVYRVDMRLRPFGDAGPLALSFAALEDYYQEHGREWERYAMVKARVIETTPGCPYREELKQLLRPFVYRRYIDFSVIESLRNMKQMITNEIRRKGMQDNIKLGPGGIREIEFIAQAFQLIRGGRLPELQVRNLLRTLKRLEHFACISAQTRGYLTQSYLFLRKTEHVLQQIGDQQTQQLPENDRDKARLASAMGAASYADFEALMNQHRDKVDREFMALFGVDEEEDSSPELNEAWQHVADDEVFNQILSEQGINEHKIAAFAEFAATVEKKSLSQRGENQLKKLMGLFFPQCEAIEVKVLKSVLGFLGDIVTRTAYLDLMIENPAVLKQLISLFSASSWIADFIRQYPVLLDELIDPQHLYHPTPYRDYPDLLREHMLRIEPDDMEQQMEQLRHFKQTKSLRIAAADVTQALKVDQVSDHLTHLAQTILAEVIQLAWQQMVAKYGMPIGVNSLADSGFAVVAYGKLGGIELGYGSDLDLVFLHRCESNAETSGPKPIESRQFYLRLSQRIMHLCNTRTNAGILYEIDTRLRPSGASGLLVIHIDNFIQYQKEEAWTWEHQALVRSRMVYGDEDMLARFSRARLEVLSQRRETELLKGEVGEMREKMRAHLNRDADGKFDLKQGQGGITDIEFLAQYLVLANSSRFPELADWPDNLRILETLARVGELSQAQQQVLSQAYLAFRGLSHRQALQQEESLVDEAGLEAMRQQVSQIWQQFLPLS